MLKKGILAVALALLFAGALAQKREVMLDKVVAVVGGSSISTRRWTTMPGSWSSSAARRVTRRTATR